MRLQINLIRKHVRVYLGTPGYKYNVHIIEIRRNDRLSVLVMVGYKPTGLRIAGFFKYFVFLVPTTILGSTSFLLNVKLFELSINQHHELLFQFSTIVVKQSNLHFQEVKFNVYLVFTCEATLSILSPVTTRLQEHQTLCG